MKKYIVKKLRQWLLESESESKSYGIAIGSSSQGGEIYFGNAPVSEDFRNRAEFSNPIHFTLYNLEGGLVIKFYQDAKGRYQETAYIVKDVDELQSKLGQMISAELLK